MDGSVIEAGAGLDADFASTLSHPRLSPVVSRLAEVALGHVVAALDGGRRGRGRRGRGAGARRGRGRAAGRRARVAGARRGRRTRVARGCGGSLATSSSLSSGLACGSLGSGLALGLGDLLLLVLDRGVELLDLRAESGRLGVDAICDGVQLLRREVGIGVVLGDSLVLS